MTLALAAIALLGVATRALSFNVDPSTVLVLQGQPDTYFGYSVALHKDRGVGWLLVGAPKAQTDQKGVHRGGAVYRCSPVNSKACQQINFDPTGPNFMSNRAELKQIDDKSGQWFGASLHSAIDNGSIVSCAQKYVYYTSSYRRRDPIGSCWVSRGSFNGFLEYSPCRLYDQWGHHKLGSCQAGFAAALSKDGSKLFMGAPGSHVWQGRVFAHNLRTDLTNSTSANNPRSEDDSYLGYSLAVGRFSAQALAPGTKTDVAIGVPRGAELTGKVVLVDEQMQVLSNITGEQIGSYFGYSLATADINGDGLDDLLIGAPFFYNYDDGDALSKDLRFETGRVYVVMQNFRHQFHIASRHDGQTNRARFGTAIANCGDINLDGNQDVAIGAPYDGPDGHGAVYIYNGKNGNAGLNQEFDQVIYAANIKLDGPPLRTFGWSLSGGLDIDNNHYPDLIVGDYDSSKALFFRTRPIVNVTTSIFMQPDYINLDERNCILPNSNTNTSGVPCVTIQYCIKYTGVGVDSRLALLFDIRLDTKVKGTPRLLLYNHENANQEQLSQILSKDIQLCRSFKAYINRQIRDKLSPIKIEIDYAISDYLFGDNTIDYQTSFSKLKPVLNQGMQDKITKKANIVKHCGTDNVCVPDLALTMVTNVDHYVVRSNEKLIIDVTVKNLGEDAFESMFYLTMPQMINFITVNKTQRNDFPICYGAKPDVTGVNIVTCDLGNPQVRNEIVKFSIVTEPAKGVFTSSEFTFYGLVNSTNLEADDKSLENNQVIIGIPIDVKIDFVLSGLSLPSSITHNLTESYHIGANTKLKTSEVDVGPEVYHIYQVYNKGPSTIHDISITVIWPSKQIDGRHLLYLVDGPLTSPKVRCKPSPIGAINPLNLKYQQGTTLSSVSTPLPNIVQSHTNKQQVLYNYSSPIKRLQYDINNKPPYQLNVSSQFLEDNRYKRQTHKNDPNDAVPSYHHKQSTAQAASSSDSATWKQEQNFYSCGPTQCTRFECNAYDLHHNEMVTIKIRARVYKETLDLVASEDLDISSRAVAQVMSLPYNVSLIAVVPITRKAVTQVHMLGVTMKITLHWRLILMSFILALVLFCIVSWFLYRIGFFDRKRPTKIAPAEINREQPPEQSVWDSYQYSPGDTAL